MHDIVNFPSNRKKLFQSLRMNSGPYRSTRRSETWVSRTQKALWNVSTQICRQLFILLHIDFLRRDLKKKCDGLLRGTDSSSLFLGKRNEITRCKHFIKVSRLFSAVLIGSEAKKKNVNSQPLNWRKDARKLLYY